MSTSTSTTTTTRPTISQTVLLPPTDTTADPELSREDFQRLLKSQMNNEEIDPEVWKEALRDIAEEEEKEEEPAEQKTKFKEFSWSPETLEEFRQVEKEVQAIIRERGETTTDAESTWFKQHKYDPDDLEGRCPQGYKWISTGRRGKHAYQCTGGRQARRHGHGGIHFKSEDGMISSIGWNKSWKQSGFNPKNWRMFQGGSRRDGRGGCGRRRLKRTRRNRKKNRRRRTKRTRRYRKKKRKRTRRHRKKTRGKRAS